MAKQHQVHVLWGQCPEEDDKPKTYTFKTKGELDAFMLGVAEMDGWMGYRTDECINDFRREQEWPQFPDMPGFVEDDEEEEVDG